MVKLCGDEILNISLFNIKFIYKIIVYIDINLEYMKNMFDISPLSKSCNLNYILTLFKNLEVIQKEFSKQ